MKLASRREIERAVAALHDVTGFDLDTLATGAKLDPLAVVAVLSTFGAAAVAIAENRDDDAHGLVRDLDQLAAISARAVAGRWAA